MNSYKALNKQEFYSGPYSIVPIRMEDRYKIMRWRNEQMYHLRQSELLTKEKQDIYFKSIIDNSFRQERPEQILFSYLEGEECIGYGGLVHINWLDKNAEISFIMDTSLEIEGFSNNWISFLGLIEQVAFQELKLYKIFTYAYDLRPHLFEPIENAGYKKEAILKNHYLYEGEFKDIIIHSKFDINYNF